MKSLAWLLLLAASPPGPLRIPFWRTEGEHVRPIDLKAKVDGAPTKVARVTAENDPLMVIAVIDLIGDLSLAQPALDALVAEIEKLPPNATVALLRAQDGLRVLEDPGTPREKIIETIRALTITGRAGLLDSIEPSVRLADGILKKSRTRVAVFYVSDGLISQYREDYTNPVVNSSDANDMSRRFPEGLVKEKIRQLKEQMMGTLAPVFLVHLNYQSDRLNEAYQTGLMDLAETSGGAAEFCRTAGDIPGAIAHTFAKVTALQVAETEPKARTRELSLEAPGRTLKHRIHYRTKP